MNEEISVGVNHRRVSYTINHVSYRWWWIGLDNMSIH